MVGEIAIASPTHFEQSTQEDYYLFYNRNCYCITNENLFKMVVGKEFHYECLLSFSTIYMWARWL